jgi:serine/threonine protein kinase
MRSGAYQSPIAPEIGKYHVVAELARGGMGIVYLAASQGPGGFSKLVVVKELKPEFSDDERYVAMFLDEARLAARMNHPNIVQTNEVGSDGERHFMVMEFLDGRSLHRVGKRLGDQLPVGAHLRIIGEALRGLHYAHELRSEFDGEPLGIVHRDVSPLNVLVTFDGQAKVLDFGIAKAADSSHETKLGVLKGRVAYMAPEQAKGIKVDRRADIYSAGVMLFEAAARGRLWPKMTEVEILTRMLRDGPPALRTVCPDAPEDLERICARAMRFNREDRYQTALDLSHDLEAHLARRADTMTMREVGAQVGQAFADERRTMNATIDDALVRARGGPRSGTMPAFRGLVSGTPSSARIQTRELDDVSSRQPAPSDGCMPNSTSIGPLLDCSSRPAQATSATLASARPAPTLRRRTFHRVTILACGCGALLLGSILWVAALRVAKPAAQSAGPPPAATTSAVERADLFELVVRVSPPSAQIAIDGASVESNPFHGRYRKDSQMHHIVASANGYESKLEDIRFANDLSIDVALSPRANAPAPPIVGPPPAATRALSRLVAPPSPKEGTAPDAVAPPLAPGPRLEFNPTGGRVPLRPIATSDPYGAP